MATIVSFAISLPGVEGIINIAVPVLTAVVPIVICLILFSIFDKKTGTMAYLSVALSAPASSASSKPSTCSLKCKAETLSVVSLGKVANFPLGNFAFEWLVPALVCAVIGGLLGKYANFGGTREDVYREQAIREEQRAKN